jgi:hypothetical protein
MLNPADDSITVDKEWSLRALRSHDHLLPIFFDMLRIPGMTTG